MGFSTSLGQSDGLTKVGKILSFFCAFAIFLTGIVHVFSLFETWCHSKEGVHCVGPWLHWSIPGEDWNSATLNGASTDQVGTSYRSVFSLNLITCLADIWAPVLIGAISMSCHVASLRKEALTASWFRVTFWYVFAVFFGCFGFAGGFGVLCGMMVLPFCCPVFLLCGFLRAGNDVSLDIGGGGDIGSTDSDTYQSPDYAQQPASDAYQQDL